MNISNPVSGIAAAVDEPDFHLRMIEQQANQFARRISRSADYSNFYFHT
jgi:hypothetical protein